MNNFPEFEIPAGRAVFDALQGKPLYEGTVPEHVKAKRRAKNKQARKSRKANRK